MADVVQVSLPTCKGVKSTVFWRDIAFFLGPAYPPNFLDEMSHFIVKKTNWLGQIDVCVTHDVVLCMFFTSGVPGGEGTLYCIIIFQQQQQQHLYMASIPAAAVTTSTHGVYSNSTSNNIVHGVFSNSSNNNIYTWRLFQQQQQ